MKTVAFSVYDAFSDVPYGGSQGGIVLDAIDIDADARLLIAKQLGLPAVCFVMAYDDRTVTARFQSTEREYPMCGHGTICLMTQMIEMGVLNWNGAARIDVELDLPGTKADVEIYRRDDGRAVVMLDIVPPKFRLDDIDKNELAGLLGLDDDCFSQDLPIETAVGDFVHLVVPVKDLASMKAIVPNFSGITQYASAHGIETVVCFVMETEQSDHGVHVRDFCPAVGVPESAAAGTTNAALTSYLIRHGMVEPDAAGRIDIKAEQGMEIGRPSSIQSIVTIRNKEIERLQIGGVASKVIEGLLRLPKQEG